MGPHQGVTPESPAVHHADVEGWVEQLILREVLGSRGVLVIKGWGQAVGCLLWWLERPLGSKTGIVLEEEVWSSSSMAWEPSKAITDWDGAQILHCCGETEARG